MNIFEKVTAIEKQADDFGFMWSNTAQIFEQIQSECEEIKDSLAQLGDRSHLQEEMGDLIHAIFSLCLFMKFDLEETCVKSIEKFEKRFIELKKLAHDAGFETLKGQPFDVLIHFWRQAKEKVLSSSCKHAPSWQFRFLSQVDIPLIISSFTAIGWNKPTSLYQNYLKEQEDDQRCVWVVFKDNDFAGYVTLKWHSDYLPFREQNIPEISDLNVLPKFRKQGLASALLDRAEIEAFKKSPIVGIGVGLSSDYGDAQKLYIKCGYIPDGLGITYNYQPVKFGDTVYLDDDLVLWFKKCLYKE
ncbi:GNAT family N-acetyltransferase [Kamptonema cortianum]|jgi:NTP pyrophosphatase (non-canonical NTP hydrolase)/GNAT superfamily N-acetyltransferase|nr:GNAT family N-acetyltransferase [Geitlerinema splendidum]MDK3160835.1 GNAT family N-acetyltransferase [Kamptonema cortianum]